MSLKHINGLDLLKFVAVIMITNSHFVPLYKEHHVEYPTFGVHGNALFFFVSGYLIINICNTDGSYINFLSWFKKRIYRLWPPLIVYSILASLVYSKPIEWVDFLLAGNYWFVRCFIFSFVFIYFILRYFRKYLFWFLLSSIGLTALMVIISNKVTGSIYHDGLIHYICYFSTMLMGVLVGVKSDIIKYKSQFADIALCIGSFVLYFVIMHFSKGKLDTLYYIQLLAILPLLLFLYYAFKVVNRKWSLVLAKTRLWGIVHFISALTYEIYIVQFDIITDRFNVIYPFNTILILFIIIVAAYILKVFTNFFVLTISKDDWNLIRIFSLK